MVLFPWMASYHNFFIIYQYKRLLLWKKYNLQLGDTINDQEQENGEWQTHC